MFFINIRECNRGGIVMSYEINVIAINQSTPIYWKGRSSILLHNELENEEVNRYADIWPFFLTCKAFYIQWLKR